MSQDLAPASKHEIALSMMRLWGKDAETMARNYALDCWRKGDAAAYMRWHSVEWMIEKARPQAYEGTVSGEQPPHVAPRRPRWFEVPLQAVMPALRELGSSVMRGTGL